MRISEIFYSLQGEGARVGAPSLFVRFSGCSAKHACYASGVVCDTEFESGKEYSKEQVYDFINRLSSSCTSIIWTGGEPADQLTEEIINYFAIKGYYQCVETSGVKPLPPGLSYVAISPKVAEHVLKKNFSTSVDELRYVRHIGQDIPQPSLKASYYYLSPHFNGDKVDPVNVLHVIELCKRNPLWRLSIQTHKLLNIN